MSRLEAVLDEFVNGPAGARLTVALGDRAADAAAAAALEQRLRTLRRQLEAYFIVCVAMIILLFLVQVVIVLTQLDRPDVVKGAVGACGVTTLGLILLMAKLWRDRDRTATIIALAQALEPADLRAVLHVMLEQQYGRRQRASGAGAAAPDGKATGG